ncbi:MAG: STM3941 family protein [Weeksellaceae bacterium]
MNETFIKLNKKRFRRLLFLNLIPFIFCVLFVTMPKAFSSGLIKNSTIIIVIGILGVLFFGITLIYVGRKLSNKNLGLSLSDEGLLDTTTAFRFGSVDWEDISGFRAMKIARTQTIAVDLINPDKYISRIDSKVFTRASEQNLKVYGTPVFINCDSLDMDNQQLLNLLTSELEKRKKA